MPEPTAHLTATLVDVDVLAALGAMQDQLDALTRVVATQQRALDALTARQRS